MNWPVHWQYLASTPWPWSEPLRIGSWRGKAHASGLPVVPVHTATLSILGTDWPFHLQADPALQPTDDRLDLRHFSIVKKNNNNNNNNNNKWEIHRMMEDMINWNTVPRSIPRIQCFVIPSHRVLWFYGAPNLKQYRKTIVIPQTTRNNTHTSNKKNK